jgi:predicted transposase YbfD/YdcC
MQKFAKIFRSLPDPRTPNALHELLDILVIALAAVLCGATTATDMALFGRSKEKLLRQFLRLENGIPSHDTFSRVFRALDPEAFERIFRRFMAAFAKANGIKLTGVVAVDGKAVRGAYERSKSSTPLHMVNVFAAEARMVLASRKAPGRNEAQGALEILQMLSLEGCIVTADALHCSRPFATMVLERGAHYVLALKQNQGKLFDAVERRFARTGKRSVAKSIEPSTHDRQESRRATVIRDTSVAAANRFPGVVALARITSRRRLRGKRADKPVVRYYLLSKYMAANRVLQAVRAHWGIENRLHWVARRRVQRGSRPSQKRQRARKPRCLAAVAINIIRAHPARISMRQKVKRAGWDDAFLLDLLTHMR